MWFNVYIKGGLGCCKKPNLFTLHLMNRSTDVLSLPYIYCRWGPAVPELTGCLTVRCQHALCKDVTKSIYIYLYMIFFYHKYYYKNFYTFKTVLHFYFNWLNCLKWLETTESTFINLKFKEYLSPCVLTSFILASKKLAIVNKLLKVTHS